MLRTSRGGSSCHLPRHICRGAMDQRPRPYWYQIGDLHPRAQNSARPGGTALRKPFDTNNLQHPSASNPQEFWYTSTPTCPNTRLLRQTRPAVDRVSPGCDLTHGPARCRSPAAMHAQQATLYWTHWAGEFNTEFWTVSVHPIRHANSAAARPPHSSPTSGHGERKPLRRWRCVWSGDEPGPRPAANQPPRG